MFPIAVVLLKFGVAGAGYGILAKLCEKASNEKQSNSVAKAAVSSASAAAAGGALVLLTMDAFLRGMFLVFTKLEDELP